MKKQCIKIISSLLIGVILAGEAKIPVTASAVPSFQNQTISQKVYSSEDLLNKGVSKLLGYLDTQVTAEERKTVSQMVSTLSNMQHERESKNIFNPTKQEEELAYQLCAYLDGLTLKYMTRAKVLLDYGPFFGGNSELPENNVIINNLKQTLSSSDYKKITKLYNQYRKDNKESYLEKIYLILAKYKSLDAEAVFYNIFGVDMPMKGQFEINHDDLSIEYLNPKRYGLSKLSDKELKKYRKVWSLVKQILPAEYFNQFKEFDIASDGEYGIMAYVVQVDENGKTWKMCIDPADMGNKTDFALTVVHEFSHYLSFNNEQVSYFAGKKNLVPSFKNYTDNEVVANEDSYLNQFYQEFWSDMVEDWKADTDNVLFYARHYDEFVTEYAATQCAEDFAETFSYYVLGKSDATMDMKLKMEFFNKFPELKQMKQEILDNMEKNHYFE